MTRSDENGNGARAGSAEIRDKISAARASYDTGDHRHGKALVRHLQAASCWPAAPPAGVAGAAMRCSSCSHSAAGRSHDTSRAMQRCCMSRYRAEPYSAAARRTTLMSCCVSWRWSAAVPSSVKPGSV